MCVFIVNPTHNALMHENCWNLFDSETEKKEFIKKMNRIAECDMYVVCMWRRNQNARITEQKDDSKIKEKNDITHKSDMWNSVPL